MNKKFFAKKRFKVLAGAVLLLLAGSLVSAKFFSAPAGDEYVTATVFRGDLVQTVGEVGMVKASDGVELSFSSGGKLEEKFAKIGDEVKTGDVLAKLDGQSLLIQRQQAESSLISARASLSKLLSGATASDLAVTEAQVREAQKAAEASASNLEKVKRTVAEEIRQAEKSLSDLQNSGADNQTTYEQSVLSARTALDNAKAIYQKSIDNSIETSLTDIGAKLAVANTALDNVDTILSNDTLKDFLSAKNKAYLSDTKTAYAEAELLSVSANASLFQALQDRSEVKVKTAVSDALAYLNRTVDALKSCYSALEASTIAQAALDAYKSTISGQLSLANSAVSVVQADKQASDGAYLAYSTNVSAAENSLRGADVALENAITNAKNVLSSARLSGEARVASAESGVKTSQEAYEVAKSQLAKLKSSARSEDVALANAQVSQAQSSLELINKQIEDSVLRAPLDGRVVRDEFERGEQISPGRTVFSLLDQSDYEVEVDISESDIAKINKGAEAEMTLDAFGDGRKFKAVVDFVEPAETVIQDVVYYKVTLIFSDKAESLSDIRPGMTANVTIFTAKSEQALIVPERAIIDKTDKGKVIRILRDGKVFESPVKTGLRGDGGMIEAISGVSAGDEVVVFVKAKK